MQHSTLADENRWKSNADSLTQWSKTTPKARSHDSKMKTRLEVDEFSVEIRTHRRFATARFQFQWLQFTNKSLTTHSNEWKIAHELICVSGFSTSQRLPREERVCMLSIDVHEMYGEMDTMPSVIDSLHRISPHFFCVCWQQRVANVHSQNINDCVSFTVDIAALFVTEKKNKYKNIFEFFRCQFNWNSLNLVNVVNSIGNCGFFVFFFVVECRNHWFVRST